MRKILAVLALTLGLMLANAGGAEARLFEPHPDWRRSGGRACAESRGPPERHAEALPPRACRAADPDRATIPKRSLRTAFRMPYSGR